MTSKYFFSSNCIFTVVVWCLLKESLRGIHAFMWVFLFVMYHPKKKIENKKQTNKKRFKEKRWQKLILSNKLFQYAYVTNLYSCVMNYLSTFLNMILVRHKMIVLREYLFLQLCVRQNNSFSILIIVLHYWKCNYCYKFLGIAYYYYACLLENRIAWFRLKRTIIDLKFFVNDIYDVNQFYAIFQYHYNRDFSEYFYMTRREIPFRN
jgi:hypothetical protein